MNLGSGTWDDTVVRGAEYCKCDKLFENLEIAIGVGREIDIGVGRGYRF